jgi:predicted dinucleotide-binding enzyme
VSHPIEEHSRPVRHEAGAREHKADRTRCGLKIFQYRPETSTCEILNDLIRDQHAKAKARRARLDNRDNVIEREVTTRPSLVYCGDDSRSKELAAGLIRDVGFDPVDAGPLRIARYTEPFALLVAQLAYEGQGGPELAYRFERF